jgi:hypothetical protein
MTIMSPIFLLILLLLLLFSIPLFFMSRRGYGKTAQGGPAGGGSGKTARIGPKGGDSEGDVGGGGNGGPGVTTP